MHATMRDTYQGCQPEEVLLMLAMATNGEGCARVPEKAGPHGGGEIHKRHAGERRSRPLCGLQCIYLSWPC